MSRQHEGRSKGTEVSLRVREIQSLNLDQLDVEDLEHRLELATALPVELSWGCDCNGDCPTQCTSNCQNCPAFCSCEGTYSCDTYCPVDCPSNCPVACTVNCGVDI